MSDGRKVKRALKMEDPTVRYAVTKPEFQDEHAMPELYYPAENCDGYESPVGKLYQHIADLTGQQSYYNETRGPGSNRRRRLLHDHRWLHGSDSNVADAYIDRYMEAYKDSLDTTSPLDMAFGDIEVDGVDHRGFPDEHEAPCPISLLTYFNKSSKHLVQFLPRHLVRDNPQIAAFERDLAAMELWILCEVNRKPLERGKFVEEGAPWGEIQDLILREDGSAEDAPLPLRCLTNECRFFDTEREATLAFLHHINEVDRPDTMAFWNGHFDILTIMNRLRRATDGGTMPGIDPEAAFTAKDFRPWVYADYHEDTFNTQETDRGDLFQAAGYTIFLDQMLLYASLRKQTGKKESYGLDFTLRAELGEGKLENTGDIRDLAYRDYAKFVLYGATDVVPMATLEERTEDISLAYRLSVVTRTRIHHVMKKTVCLRNLANVFFRDQGMVLSNNRNKNVERTETEKFRGGFVASPHLMDAAGTMVGGEPSERVWDHVVDFDATALYPSIILMCNIDLAGQVGRLLFEMADGSERDTGTQVEAWACGDPIELGKAWFSLPGLGELASEVLRMSALAPQLAALPPSVDEEDPFDQVSEDEFEAMGHEERGRVDPGRLASLPAAVLETAGDEYNWEESGREEAE